MERTTVCYACTVCGQVYSYRTECCGQPLAYFTTIGPNEPPRSRYTDPVRVSSVERRRRCPHPGPMR